MDRDRSFKLACVQTSPAFLDLEQSLDITADHVKEAAANEADLVVFPEAFLPGYPVWVWFIPSGKTHPLRALYSELHANAVSIPGPATDRLCEMAQEYQVTLAIGVNERNADNNDSTLYNTLLYIGPDGSILGKHRKLIPTSGERMVWGRGDGSDLEVYDMPFGRISGLICWENYMPLARYALAAWGVQIYVAPTWDHGEPWISSMRHIAKECRCFVIGCCQALEKSDIPDRPAFKEEYLGGIETWINTGDSLIVDPDGKIIAGPANREKTILYADVTLDQFVGPRWQLDIAGHYSRPDIFELRVHKRETPAIHTFDDPPAETIELPTEEL